MSLTTSEMSPADFAAVSGRNNDGFGDGAWWIILLFLFAGWGRGFGGGSGTGCGSGSVCATSADVRNAVDQQTLISKLDQQTYGLADATYALNNSITTGFHGVDNAICNLGYNMQNGFNSLGHQLSDCCCTTQRAIDAVNYNLASQSCETRNTIQNTTRDVIDNQNANARAILDALTAQRLADKDEKIAEQNQKIFSLQLAASQAQQNQYLINEIRPCPIPAYITCNPYAASYGNCGCGGNF